MEKRNHPLLQNYPLYENLNQIDDLRNYTVAFEPTIMYLSR